MDPFRRQAVQDAFAALERRVGTTHVTTVALARALSSLPATYDIFDRYFRIISAVHPQPGLLLSALHYLALTGQAPALAAFLPTCGGAYTHQQEDELRAAVQGALSRCPEDVLDFLLSHQPQSPEARRIAAVALGVSTTAASLGGGVSLFELGSGLNLYPDKFRYQFGEMSFGVSGPIMPVGLYRSGSLAELLAAGLPPVVGRQALDLHRVELGDAARRQLQLSFVWPDQTERAQRLQAAHGVLASNAPLPARYGDVHFDLLPAMTAAYEAMAPGNTFLLLHVMTWAYLPEDERIAVTSCVQRLGQRLQPHKPMAWLQVEPNVSGSELEVKLSTYGWADQEDRTVRLLAHGPFDLNHLRWLE